MVVLLVLVLLAAGAWLGVRALQAKERLEQARGHLQDVRTALESRDVAAARAAADAAQEQTGRSVRLTSDPVWRVAERVPLLGRSLRTAGGVAEAADDLTAAALPPLLDAVEVVDPQELRRPDGSFDLAPLRSAGEPLATALQQVESARSGLRGLPEGLVLPPVGSAREDLVQQVDELAGAVSGAVAAVDIAALVLGEDRLRRFFVLVQQTSESRGTGGLPGGFVVLEAEDGRLRVTAQGSNADLRNEVIPPPPGVPADYVEHYRDFGAFGLWQNINVSPDLPVVARVVADRWRRQSGQSVDGVIALDSQALAQLLRGAGPISLPSDRQLLPEDVVDYLAVGQYEDFAPPTGATGIDRSEERKEVLARISQAATQRLVSGGGDSEQLLLGLVEALRSGHLRMTAFEDPLRSLLAEAGVDGGLPDGEAPVAYPVVFNSTGGKLDHWLERSVSYEAGPCDGPRRRSTITVELRNEAPTEGLPPYLTTRIDENGLTTSSTNAVTLQVYGTRGALLEDATLDGEPVSRRVRADGQFLRQSDEGGLPMWHLRVELPPGQTRTLELRLVEPVVAGEPRVPEQPLARPLARRVDVPVC
jgi:hypothetical protein